MSASFQHITSITEVQQLALQALNYAELLVIFDMDLTLTMPQTPALTHLIVPKYREKLRKILAPLTDLERRRVLALSLASSEHLLVEQNAPQVIKNLQSQGIKIIVLTATLTGKLQNIGNIDKIEVIRFQKLQELGIDLQEAFEITEITLSDLAAYNQNYPTYYKGLLCANAQRGTNMKGPVLVSFINYTGFKPKYIIMVDDKILNLQDVKQSLNALDNNIKFVGIEYKGVYNNMHIEIEETAFINYWQDLANKTVQGM